MAENEEESKRITIEFERSIDLFTPKQIFRIPSDYQFFSFIEDLFFNKISNNEKQSFTIEPFLEFLRNKKGNGTSDYLKRFFFQCKEYGEDSFNDFLFKVFRSMCPDYQLDISDKTYLDIYQRKFTNPSNIKIVTKAKYFWMLLGFEENDFSPTIIPDNSNRFDIQKILCIHNMCNLFSFKFYFINQETTTCSTDPLILQIGSLNSDNTILSGIDFDRVQGQIKAKLLLAKPEPKILNTDLQASFGQERSKDLYEIKLEDDPIYNIQLVHCYLTEKPSFDGNLHAQIKQFNSANIDGKVYGLKLKKETPKVTLKEFIYPIFTERENEAKLYSIITANKGVEIIDICCSCKKIYVLSRMTKSENEKATFVQVHEGNIGTQYLDDMYLCHEHTIEESDARVFGKIGLKRSKLGVRYPIAIYFYYREEGEYNRYDFRAYIKPVNKTIPCVSISKPFSKKKATKYTNNANFFYPSSTDYFVPWRHYKNSEIIKKLSFPLKRSVFEIEKVDFDGFNIILYSTNGEIKKICLYDLENFDLSKVNDVTKRKEEKIKGFDEFNSMFGFDDIDAQIAAIEIDNSLFLITNKKENAYYHPARFNFNLEAAINSAFYRYKENMPPIQLSMPSNLIPFVAVNVMIDVGYEDDINQEFHSNSIIPGIYISVSSTEFYDNEGVNSSKVNSKVSSFKMGYSIEDSSRIENSHEENSKENKSVDDEDDDELTYYMKKGDRAYIPSRVLRSKSKNKGNGKVEGKIVYYFKVAFSNAGMNVGKDAHRTKCQLAAAYATATNFSLYGPFKRIYDFKSIDEVIDNWKYDNGIEMLSNLIATYGVLLEMKSENEFNVAMNTLKITKEIRDDFDKFYGEQFKTIWDWS